MSTTTISEYSNMEMHTKCLEEALEALWYPYTNDRRDGMCWWLTGRYLREGYRVGVTWLSTDRGQVVFKVFNQETPYQCWTLGPL